MKVSCNGVYSPYNLKAVKKASKKDLFKVVSFFAGGGGSSTGYRLAGGNVIAVNEFIPKAQEAYRKNYPNTFIFTKDIRKLSPERILKKLNLKVGELCILDGSPPCSSFSMAGKREKGWGDVKKYSDTTQRTDDLFYEFARMVKGIQPKVFIAENVKGLTIGAARNILGGDQVGFFEEYNNTFISALKKAGYRVAFKVLNAKYYNVPQERSRLIIIGVRNDLNVTPTFPPQEVKRITSVESALSTVRNTKEDLQTVVDFTKNHAVMELIRQCRPGECPAKYHPKGFYFTSHKLDLTLPSPTILATLSSGVYHPDNRLVTIPELKRICGFPDDYYLGESLKDQWERLGRAVPPLMMKEVSEHIYKTILSKTK